ncbi:MAG TPA: endonuclease/exonuclease/phosphatase family protein, partial [Caulifigura sp.]|nr:endonuclease/exonuclease/phosphatase family protein [Caulifigura sp.]
TPFGEWTVFACDIAANQFYQREPHLRELAKRAGLRKNPVIIIGDFNTPMDSVHLGLLRNMGLTEAFESAGSGYQPTWPVPCPVLSLDQIWLDPRLQPISCSRHWSWRSDHAAAVAVIRPTSGI